MAATNQQMSELSTGATFQKKVVASIMKKALAIREDILAKGTLEVPKQGQTPNYSVLQGQRAYSLGVGAVSPSTFYLPMACSTNVIASGISVSNGETLSDISDASLDSQVYTVVFQDLV